MNPKDTTGLEPFPDFTRRMTWNVIKAIVKGDGLYEAIFEVCRLAGDWRDEMRAAEAAKKAKVRAFPQKRKTK